MSDTSLSLILLGLATFVIMAILACHIVKLVNKNELRKDNIRKNPNNS